MKKFSLFALMLAFVAAPLALFADYDSDKQACLDKGKDYMWDGSKCVKKY